MKHTGIRYLTVLPFALAAIATSAVELSHDGRGDVLLYPFYSAEGGNDTYISVANNTDHPKALRVRFRQGVDNAEVLSFNLYLGARDHWAGAVTTAIQKNGARLTSSDESCTYPEQPNGGFIFSDPNYENYYPPGLERTREGMVEIIEMGILDDNSDNGSFGAIQGIFGPGIGEGRLDEVSFTVTPIISGCEVINEAWQPSRAFARDPSLNISQATGGLSGYGVVINVSEGTNITYNATALKNFFDGGFLHAHPDEASPSLADAAPVARIYHEDHGLIELETEAGVDAVSSVLIRSEIGNDFVTEPGINAATEWVVNFPMRTDEDDGGSFQMKVYERTGEASFAFAKGVFYFHPPGNNHFVNPDRTVNVLEFGGTSTVLHASSRIGQSIGVEQGIVNGHAVLNLRTYRTMANLGGDHKTTFDTDRGPLSLIGVPVIGFAVQKYVNGNVNGVLSNYTGTQNYHSALEIETQGD